MELWAGGKMIKKRDVIFFLAIGAVCAVLFLTSRIFKVTGDSVQIYKEGKLYAEISLNKDQEIDIDGKIIVKIKDGKAFMYYADCPDKLCIKQGKISDNSRDIVCLPNKVSVRVGKKSETDAVAK